MHLTSTGKWLLDAFLNKEPHGDDRELAAIVDTLQAYDEDPEATIEDGFLGAAALAIRLNLVTK